MKLSNVPPGFELTQEPACASAASAPWLPVADHEFSPGWFVRTRSYADGKRVRKAWRFGEGGRVFHVKKDALESQAEHAQDKGARTDCEAAAAASRAEAVPPNAAIETEQAGADKSSGSKLPALQDGMAPSVEDGPPQRGGAGRLQPLGGLLQRAPPDNRGGVPPLGQGAGGRAEVPADHG